MAKLYITEYAQPMSYKGPIPVAQEVAVAEQVVTFTTSTQSAVFNADTKLVRIHTDSVCSIKFGQNPVAVVTEKRLAANQTEYFGVTGGHKVAAVTNT